MNFTHLASLDEPSLSQEDLQRFDYYLVIGCLTDDQAGWVIDQAGSYLEASRSVLCWLVLPRHMKIAPRTSPLRRIYDDLVTASGAVRIEHSFIAWMSRADFVAGRSENAHYAPLFLYNENDLSKRRALLLQKVHEAFANTEQRPANKNEQPSWMPAPIKVIGYLLNLLLRGHGA